MKTKKQIKNQEISNNYKSKATIFKSYDELPRALSVANVATALNISQTNAYTLVRSESFPKIKVGCRTVVPRDALIRWIESQLHYAE